jgi:HD-GYP domain-containing protein (c-di-GMP phosphodiesterase class II)
MFKWILQLLGLQARAKSHSTKTSSRQELTKTPVEELMVGMYVGKLDRPWLESPFKFQGFNIKTHRELQQVKSVCQFVYIDTTKQTRQRIVSTNDRIDRPLIIGKPPEKRGSFKKEYRKATQNYRATGKLVSDFMKHVENGGGIDTTLAKEAVASSVDSILHSPDAHLGLSQLKNKDKYTAQHSLNVCMLSIVLGRHIGLDEKELRKVGLCGMMHDMGKMLIPTEVLNKPGELDPDELATMQTHTTLGSELLKSSPNMFSGAIETALTHHERMNGTGYPKGLRDGKMSYYSKIVSIVDTYDALTSDRVYRASVTHLDATQILYEQAGNAFDNQLITKFIESLGVFPPGCYVALSDKRIALVVETNQHTKLRPKVIPILSAELEPIKEKVINLEGVLTDSKGQALFIQNIVMPETYHLDNNKHFQQRIINDGFAMTMD